MPALAGTLLAGVFLLLARRVLGSERAAAARDRAAALDGVYLVQSRVAMTNVFAVLFQLLSALLVLRAGRRAPAAPGADGGRRVRARPRAVDALDEPLRLGLPRPRVRRRCASRATPAGPAELDAPRPGALGREIALAGLTFVVLPALVYLLSYLPLMLQSHPQGLAGWGEAVLGTVRAQRDIWGYHANLSATHAYFSAWWTWPLLYRPTWYFWWSGAGVIRGIVALGNPAIWWASVPVCGWALVSGLRARDPRRVFAGAGFFLLYLPWAPLAAARSTSATTCSRRSPTRAWRSGCCSIAPGTAASASWPGPTSRLPLLFLLFLPLLTGTAGAGRAVGLPLPAAWAAGSGPGSRPGSSPRGSGGYTAARATAMALIDGAVAGELRKAFGALVHPVRLAVFSDADGEAPADEVRQLVEELAALDPRLSAEAHSADVDGDRARASSGSSARRRSRSWARPSTTACGSTACPAATSSARSSRPCSTSRAGTAASRPETRRRSRASSTT